MFSLSVVFALPEYETWLVPGAESFAAVVEERTATRIRVYDLSSALPVLRTFQPAQLRIIPGSAWSHATAVQSYTENELGILPSRRRE